MIQIPSWFLWKSFNITSYRYLLSHLETCVSRIDKKLPMQWCKFWYLNLSMKTNLDQGVAIFTVSNLLLYRYINRDDRFIMSMKHLHKSLNLASTGWH
jgi:lipoprotein NlpI